MDASDSGPEVVSVLGAALLPEDEGTPLDVPLNYEIITLFSEGLYQSPHKAVEELVSNSYDAGANTVMVILPRDEEEQGSESDSLFVIDDGIGMDAPGFEILWRIAESTKSNSEGKVNGRYPIGQFGIGKLAAYVLAWRLTHVSKVGSEIHYTTMDFRRVQSHRLHGPDEQPLQLRLHKINQAKAKELLFEIKGRDPTAWAMLFGRNAKKNWTVAAMSEFKGLYEKLEAGTLHWVLRTGLPITSNFALYLNAEKLVSPKVAQTPLFSSAIGGGDPKGKELEADNPDEFKVTASGIEIAGIKGTISGQAELYEQPLDRGKSGSQYHRTNGFFIKVRGRIINLEDELFGLEPQNHAAWSRFVMIVDADGLRDHLLSSREGVKASRAISLFRQYVHEKFKECRVEYEKDAREKLKGLDIQQLISDAPSTFVVEPLIGAVESELDSPGGAYYLSVPDVPATERTDWIDTFSKAMAERPIESVRLESLGSYDRLAKWDAGSRELVINRDHPYMAKLETHTRNDTPLKMISTVEVVTDALLSEAGLRGVALIEFFERRDRVLRVVAGDTQPNAHDILRGLNVANEDEVALERAVGRAFHLLGLEYERGGLNLPGDDGYLVSRLGVVGGASADFSVVYDAKSTISTSVPADKCDFGSLETFRANKVADYAFFVAKAFAGQGDPDSKINDKLNRHKGKATLLTIDSIKRLVGLHVRFGVPMSELRDLFEQRGTQQVSDWLDSLEAKLSTKRVPLGLLLEELEKLKTDPFDTPNVKAARQNHPELQGFGAEKLAAVLRGVEALIGSAWIEVVEPSYDVVLHSKPDKIIEQFEKQATDDGS